MSAQTTRMPVVELAMVRITDLLVDPDYQRPLDSGRAERIAKSFADGAMKAVSVSRRNDGRMFVYDGHHTVNSAQLAGFTHVPAVIVDGDQKKEAGWFVAINGGGTKRVTQGQVQTAGVVAGDQLSARTKEVLDTYGLTIGTGGLRKGHTNAIGAIKRYLVSSPVALKHAMNSIHALWENDDCAWSGVILRGMFDIVKTGGDIEKVVSECRRKKITPRRVMDIASAMQTAAGASGGGAAHAKAAILKACGIKADDLK